MTTASVSVAARSDEARRCVHGARWESARVNTVRVDAVGPEMLVGAVQELISCGSSHVVNFICADPATLSRRDAGFRNLLDRGCLNIPDGVAVVWALRLFGLQARRLAGTEALLLLCERGVPLGTTHFLYGTSDLTLRRLQAELIGRYPGLRIVGAEAPPYAEPTDEALEGFAARCRAAKTQLLWVALGTPRQNVVAQRLRQLDAAPVILCVGAAFDFVAGTKVRAPVWMQRAGLEWMHRLVKEPRRLWKRYLLGNPRFAAGVFLDYVRRLHAHENRRLRVLL